MESVVDKLIAFATTYGLKIIGAIIILIIGRIAAGAARKFVRKMLAKQEPSIISFAGSFAYILVLAFAVLAALAKFGIQTASFIAVLGAAGFAV
ncbi:MAG: mechanosensitive ion channel family protein, partial [Planctomycetota bacterium]